MNASIPREVDAVHFVLECAPSSAIVEGPELEEPWCEGYFIEVPTIEAPFQISIELTDAGEPATIYDGVLPLWSDRLVRAMQEVGVDNLQLHPAIIRDVRSSREWPYWAVNVVGLVAAVDFKASGLPSDAAERSDLEPEWFVIDQAKAEPFRIFRLAESPDLLLVDSQVRQAIERAGLRDILLTEPGPGH